VLRSTKDAALVVGCDRPNVAEKADLGAGKGLGRGLGGGQEAGRSFGVDERQTGEAE